jgi:hypothetical protein
MVVGFVIAAVLAGVGDGAFAQEIKISHQWAEAPTVGIARRGCSCKRWRRAPTD